MDWNLSQLFVLICGFSYVSSANVALSTSLGGQSDKFAEGGDAFLTCTFSVSSGETALELAFFSESNSEDKKIYTAYLGNSIFTKGPLWDTARMTNSPVDNGVTSVSLTISGIECADKKAYVCRLSFMKDGFSSTVSDTKNLEFRVEPIKPILEFVGNEPGENLPEYSVLRLSCDSEWVGDPGVGDLQWRIYRADQPENIPAADTRVSTTKTVTQCWEAASSTFTLNVTRDDQDLVVTCFAVNTVVVLGPSPPTCEANYLCSQTKKFMINYPVSPDLVILPSAMEGPIGGSLALKCEAGGYPSPDITWTKGNDSRSLTTPAKGTSTLNLDNLTLEDADIYTCTATNVVASRAYTVTRELNITIVEPPPEPTIPPGGTTNSEDNNNGGEGSGQQVKGDSGGGDDDTVIIIVVVLSVVLLIILVVLGVIMYRRRNAAKKDPQEPTKTSNNATNNISFVGSQPDLVADDKYRQQMAANADGLMYADLTYDNRPRSRKPLAIGDDSTDYSDIQLPQV